MALLPERTDLVADAQNLRLGFGGYTFSGLGEHTLDQSTDAVEFVFMAPEAATLTRVFFRQNALTGTAPVFRISLQGVNSSGNPDGTIKGSGACYVDYTPASGNNNTIREVTLGTSYTCAAGELLAVCIAHQSGTIDGSNNCRFGTNHGCDWVPGAPYVIVNSNGSRSRVGAAPNFAVGSASKIYGRPVKSINASSWTGTNERAFVFTLPSTMGSTYTLRGFDAACNISTGQTVTINLYQGTTSLASATVDSDHYVSLSDRLGRFFFTSQPTLSFGTEYRIGIVFSGSSTIYDVSMQNASDFGGWPLGTAAYFASRSSGGGTAWTDDTARRMVVTALHLGDITVPTGGSSVAFPTCGPGGMF